MPPAHGVRQRYWAIRAKQVVLATGGIERLIAFPDNDRPGVMLATAAETYVRRYGVVPGRSAVLFTNNDAAYAAAYALRDAGSAVPAIIDVRPQSVAADASSRQRLHGLDRRRGDRVIGAQSVRGVQVRWRREGRSSLSRPTCSASRAASIHPSISPA